MQSTSVQTRLNYPEYRVVCLMRGIDPSTFVTRVGGRQYTLRLNTDEVTVISTLRSGMNVKVSGHRVANPYIDGSISIVNHIGEKTVFPLLDPNYKTRQPISKRSAKPTPKKKTAAEVKQDAAKDDRIAELEEILSIKLNSDTTIHKIEPSTTGGQSRSVAIVLLSDTHVEEVVAPDSVLGLNSYNPEIAKQRMDAFFANTCKLITHDQRSYNINHVILSCLGDLIGGYLHPELEQTNAMAPMEAISFAREMILSGMRYWQDNLDVEKITFVGIIGNHARTTKKNQYANATAVNYEYFLYENLESMAKAMGLTKFEFVIPKSESTVVEVFGKRILMTHGSHVKYSGGIGGLIVPVSRWFARVAQVLKVDFALIGHFHQSIFTKKFIINGSMKGYDAFAFGLGLDFEPPQQAKIILNEKRGITSYTPIFLD